VPLVIALPIGILPSSTVKVTVPSFTTPAPDAIVTAADNVKTPELELPVVTLGSHSDVAIGAGRATPTPLRFIVCEPALLLGSTFTAAVNVPATDGANVSAIRQLKPAATLCPQVLVSEKELALVPTIEIPWPAPPRFCGELPELLSVTCNVADLPT